MIADTVTSSSPHGAVHIPAANAQELPVSKKLLWTGWVITAVVVLMLVFSGVMKLMQPAEVLTEFGRLGYPERLAIGIGIVELACVVIYMIPRTAILGAILLTGYLGGAIATHVRIGDDFIPPIIGGVLVWLGPYLRDRRLQALLPLRRK